MLYPPDPLGIVSRNYPSLDPRPKTPPSIPLLAKKNTNKFINRKRHNLPQSRPAEYFQALQKHPPIAKAYTLPAHRIRTPERRTTWTCLQSFIATRFQHESPGPILFTVTRLMVCPIDRVSAICDRSYIFCGLNSSSTSSCSSEIKASEASS